MDNHRFCFIVCTNDRQKLSECLYYLSFINIPAGYESEVLTITEANSMADGYNEGMSSSDAKYKIYIHQDIFILNRNILCDILEVFQHDDTIGMLGCIGCRNLPENAYGVASWNTGRILQTAVSLEYQNDSYQYAEVDAIDGCFMATQYDQPWRADIFDGWDFYDISQCYEFHRIGKKVVVPYQKKPWCYHDNEYSKMENYHKYRKLFIREYQDVFPFLLEKGKVTLSLQYGDLVEKTREIIRRLIDSGNIMQVCELFDQPENRGYLALKEYEVLAGIYRAELNKKGKKFYYPQMHTEELLIRLRTLKYLLKRVEFKVGYEEEAEAIQTMNSSFSVEAINKVILAYCIDKDEVWWRIRQETDHCKDER